jgi:hypothetical protein
MQTQTGKNDAGSMWKASPMTAEATGLIIPPAMLERRQGD